MARDLAANTATSTGLSLVATVTEQTDLGILNSQQQQQLARQECDTASEGSSEGGRHYAMILSPDNAQTITPRTESPWRRLSCESDSNSAIVDNQTSVSITTETKPPSPGIKREKSVVEGTVCIDREGFPGVEGFRKSTSGTRG